MALVSKKYTARIPSHLRKSLCLELQYGYMAKIRSAIFNNHRSLVRYLRQFVNPRPYLNSEELPFDNKMLLWLWDTQNVYDRAWADFACVYGYAFMDRQVAESTLTCQLLVAAKLRHIDTLISYIKLTRCYYPPLIRAIESELGGEMAGAIACEVER